MRGEISYLSNIISSDEKKVFYLDVNDVGPFSNWQQNNKDFLSIGKFEIRFFRYQVQSLPNSIKRQRILREIGFTLLDSTLANRDVTFKNENKRVYFQQAGELSDELATFYTLARLQEQNSFINIISQNTIFDRIPLVNTYFLDHETRVGGEILPSQFDPFTDLDFHINLTKVIKPYFDSYSNGHLIHNALTELAEQIRIQSGLSDDGVRLMTNAFSSQNPKIKLNPLTDKNPGHSQMNEQEGFESIYKGVFKGLRNPFTHEGYDSQFVRNRVPNKAQQIKYLCLLSLLFERAEKPMP